MTGLDDDRAQAAREADARRRLLSAGATSLPRPPWLHRSQPPSATDLIQFALWRTLTGATGRPAANAKTVTPGKAAAVDRTGVAGKTGVAGEAGAGGEVVVTQEAALLAALTLLAAARAEVDQVEAALLWAARAAGLSWPRISRAMGLASAQAAQQRFDRVTGRVGNRS